MLHSSSENVGECELIPKLIIGCLGEPCFGLEAHVSKHSISLFRMIKNYHLVRTVILQALLSSWEYGCFLGFFSLDLLHRLAFQVDEVLVYR